MVAVFFASGFEEIEAITSVDILRRAELEVITIGVGGKTIIGAHGIPVTCDITEDMVNPEEIEMLVLPGGMPGTLNLEASAVVQKSIDSVIKRGCWLGAICAAPSILGHKGLLKGKRCTCFPGMESQLGEGAEFTNQRIIQDGRIVTAKGAGAAVGFALRLVACMEGDKRAELLEASLQ